MGGGGGNQGSFSQPYPKWLWSLSPFSTGSHLNPYNWKRHVFVLSLAWSCFTVIIFRKVQRNAVLTTLEPDKINWFDAKFNRKYNAYLAKKERERTIEENRKIRAEQKMNQIRENPATI